MAFSQFMDFDKNFETLTWILTIPLRTSFGKEKDKFTEFTPEKERILDEHTWQRAS